jgi:hypothetical protein
MILFFKIVFGVFYRFRTRGFIFRKIVVYTVIIIIIIIIITIIIIVIIIILIYCSCVSNRWQWLVYMYTKYEIDYY